MGNIVSLAAAVVAFVAAYPLRCSTSSLDGSGCYSSLGLALPFYTRNMMEAGAYVAVFLGATAFVLVQVWLLRREHGSHSSGEPGEHKH